MQRFLILITLLASIALVAAACGGGGSDDEGDEGNGNQFGESGLAPLPGNTELVVGGNRFAVGLADADNNPVLGTPGTSLTLRFLFDDELKSEHEAEFVWAIPNEQGFFATAVKFDREGTWTAEAELTRDGETSLVTFDFRVVAESGIPNIGDAAPPSVNLTATDDPTLASVTTDPDPEPALYELTVADAIADDRPFVVIFATPAFCVSRFCGPIVDTVKDVRDGFADDVNFIHIEPFELDADGVLVTEEGPTGAQERVPAEPALDWRLLTEPWIFVVDETGAVTARFEFAISADELSAAIEEIL